MTDTQSDRFAERYEPMDFLTPDEFEDYKRAIGVDFPPGVPTSKASLAGYVVNALSKLNEERAKVVCLTAENERLRKLPPGQE